MKPFGRNKRFVTCKPPGYQAIHLNPNIRGKINFKINPLSRVFPTWGMEGSPLTTQNPSTVDSPPLNNNIYAITQLELHFLL